jgi:hypothetical protein
MDEDESLDPRPITDDYSRKKISPYELLLRQSRKMGGVATRTYDVTKEFLKKDIHTLNPEKFHLSKKQPGELGDTLDPKENLKNVVRKSHQILAAARSVALPTNLFPDSVVVDRTKVTIIKRNFFWSSNVISIRIEDVLNVATNTGPFFGSLTVSSRVMNSTDHYEINYFWRKDAIYLKQIIQGYVIAHHNQIETSHLERDELIKTLLELGQDADF